MSTRIAREQLHTVQMVPITAFDAADELAIDPMRSLFQRLFDAGIRVVIPCAGSAEFHSLSPEEIVAVIGMAKEVMGDEGVVVAPIGLSLQYATRLGEMSLDAGADALLVMPLGFPYLSNEGARDYYLALLDRLDAPAMIYKKAAIPSDDLLLELAGHPNLYGVKYAENNMDAFNTVVQRDAGRIDWFCGSAERFAPFYALAGSPGYTSGAGSICPRVTLAMHAAMRAGNWPEAMRLQRIILPIEHFRARADNSYNVSFLKYAVTHTGLNFGEPRPPQRRLTVGEKREIDDIIQPIIAAETALEKTALKERSPAIGNLS